MHQRTDIQVHVGDCLTTLQGMQRTGYPTQKPLQLLERIIGLATNEGDCVLDPFCGSGTTLVAAQALNRAGIGIDRSADAVELTKKRLDESVRSTSRVLEVGREAYRNADEAALAMLQGMAFVPVQRNNGIDAILKQEFDGGPVTVRSSTAWRNAHGVGAKAREGVGR